MFKLLSIREIQIKSTFRFHLTPARLAYVQNCINNTYWHECGLKDTLIHCWWECRLVKLLWKLVWRVLRELKLDLPNDPALSLL